MVRVITDSTSSIPSSLREEYGIRTLSLFVNRDGVEHVEAEMDLDAFYSDIYDMVDNIPTSSQPSLGSVRAEFEDAALAGDEVLGVFISSKMSGTFESVVQVAREVAQRHPGFSFAIVDSLTNCLEMGWSVIEGAKAAREGKALDECVECVKRALGSSRFVFAPESLRFLEKGGRIGRAAALIGNIVSISPILTVKDGFAATYAKVRTQKKAMAKMVDIFKGEMQEYGLNNIAVHYIGTKDVAQKWAQDVIEPLLGSEVRVVPASPVIGVHVGPAVGLAYECAHPIPGRFAAAHPEVVTS